MISDDDRNDPEVWDRVAAAALDNARKISRRHPKLKAHWAQMAEYATARAAVLRQISRD